MAFDQTFKLRDDHGVELDALPIVLNIALAIYIIMIFETVIVDAKKKKFLRNVLTVVGNHIITTRYADTTLFFAEIKLFEFGNEQNKFLLLREYKGIKNLKLAIDEVELFISKSQANAMNAIYNQSFSGYSLSALLEREFILTPQKLTQILAKNKVLLQ